MPERKHFLLAGEIDDLPPSEQALVLATLDQMVAASDDLAPVLEALVDRVLAPFDDGDPREARLLDGGQLQPFVRLLLVELGWLAQVPGWTAAMRIDRGLETLMLCGFL